MMKRNGVCNTICIIAVIIVFMIILSFFWDLYYGVNDDITTRNVLSGSYTGVPYPQGTQGTLTLYPITAVMSGLYTVISSVDYWGYFIVTSHLICFFVIAKSVMNRVKDHKIVVFILVFAVYWVIDIVNIIYFQFTTVAAVYAATGIFLLLLENSDLKHYIPSICMFVLSFCIRKGTTGMIIPFIALVWLFKICEKREKPLKILKRALCYCVILGIVCGALFAIDLCADWNGYRDKYYQEFETLRIKAWDYHGIPYYDSYPEFYQSLGNGQGISKEEFDLINTGNMTMDFSVDAKELLEYMTQYSQYVYGFAALKDKLALSKDLFMTGFERETIKPLLLFIGLIWILASIYLIAHRKFLHLILLCTGVLGVAAETACLLFVRRMPERVWHSLLFNIEETLRCARWHYWSVWAYLLWHWFRQLIRSRLRMKNNIVMQWRLINIARTIWKMYIVRRIHSLLQQISWVVTAGTLTDLITVFGLDLDLMGRRIVQCLNMRESAVQWRKRF